MFGTVKGKVLLATGTAIVGILLVFGVAFLAFNTTANLSQQMVNIDFRLVRIMGDLGKEMGNLRRYEKDVMINHSQQEGVEKYASQWSKSYEKAGKLLTEAQATASDAETKEKLNSLGQHMKAYAEGFVPLPRQIIDGKFRSVDDINRAMSPFKTPIHKMEGLLAEVTEKASKNADLTVADVEQEQRFSAQLMLACTLLFAAIAYATSTRVTRSIVSSLGGEPDQATAIARQIAAGDLSGRISLASGDNSSLMYSMKQMQDELFTLVAELRDMVKAGEQGDLSKRINTARKQGFGREIGEALNQLTHVTDTSLRDISRVASALANGDLSQKISASYPGNFGQTAEAVNQTVDALNMIVEEIRHITHAAAAGDFNTHLDESNKRGFSKTLAELLNNLCTTANGALSEIALIAQSLAEGNLTLKINKRYPGLFGETADGINTTVSNLQELMANIVNAIDAVSTAAQQISAGNRDLSARTEEQASSLEETAASMEQFTSMIQQNTGSAKSASQLAQEASTIARNGGHEVKATVDTMAQIQESSKKIGDIISVIDSIAFQTNILALNAAVEAARAGEQGKGFAVVASEVRSLAQRSAGAAKEISALIADSVDKVARGTTQAQQAGATMDNIVHAITQVTNIVSNINDASQEQSSGIAQVTRAISQMDEATQQNAALVEEAAASSELLAEQASELQHQVSAFRL